MSIGSPARKASRTSGGRSEIRGNEPRVPMPLVRRQGDSTVLSLGASLLQPSQCQVGDYIEKRFVISGGGFSWYRARAVSQKRNGASLFHVAWLNGEKGGTVDVSRSDVRILGHCEGVPPEQIRTREEQRRMHERERAQDADPFTMAKERLGWLIGRSVEGTMEVVVEEALQKYVEVLGDGTDSAAADMQALWRSRRRQRFAVRKWRRYIQTDLAAYVAASHLRSSTKKLRQGIAQVMHRRFPASFLISAPELSDIEETGDRSVISSHDGA